VNENLFRPFVGLRAEVNARTLLMLEYESIPEYDFDEENPIADNGKIDEVWMIIAGVRYFIFDWLPSDTGVLYGFGSENSMMWKSKILSAVSVLLIPCSLATGFSQVQKKVAVLQFENNAIPNMPISCAACPACS